MLVIENLYDLYIHLKKWAVTSWSIFVHLTYREHMQFESWDHWHNDESWPYLILCILSLNILVYFLDQMLTSRKTI